MTHFSPAGTEYAEDGQRAEVVERLRSRAVELAGAFSAEVPPYDALPQSMMDADFVPSAQLNLELFFRYLTTDAEPSEQDTRPLIERAVRLVHDGMSVDEVLANYRIGIAFFWSQLVPLLRADEQRFISEIGQRATDYAGLMMSRIAAALVADARQPRWDVWEPWERQSEIAADLLAGRDPGRRASDREPPVADAFLVAAVRLGEPTPGTLTALRARIGGLSGALLHRDSGGWAALVPLRPGDEADPVRALRSRLALRAEPHPQLWIGVAVATAHPLIPSAFAEARTVAEAARCLERADIVCRRQDMLFEYAIATADSALPNLAAILDPLDDQPSLGRTLTAFIDNHFNHNAVARALFIHRNTVTYRLSRIGELTGYDPQDPAGIATLMAASVAQRLRARSFRA
ncbi:PucR family transcriptional regulator [Nocardia otitidiscaviarum]|nr:helix-turn-helix domain-containing protein [Nocardia otitidiscaviarum]MBF6179728.1 helix-turn-helix domain-containing protein [Nocardia otitidiscaviarum]MCP9620903.1 helix-turn-helix domain-containing protein [Nocardia otitidiscaviarum]